MSYRYHRDSFFLKAFYSWQHFGTRMMLSKAWEKYIVDRYRFRTNCVRCVPHFPSIQEDVPLIENGENSKRISICYLLHYFFPDKQGGTERFVLNLAKMQQQLGNQVRVLTLGKRERACYRHCTKEILWDEFDFEGIPVTQLRYQRAPRGLYYDEICPEEPQMTLFAEMALKRYAPDIVHFAYPQPFAAFAQVCHQRGIPYIATLTDFNILCHYSSMVDKKGRFCEGSQQGARCQAYCKTYGVRDAVARYQNAVLLLRQAVCITVPSAFVASLVHQEFSSEWPRIIPHGLDDAFRTGRKRAHTTVFLYVGTLTALKGVHLMLQAFRETAGDICLEIYGKGDSAYTMSLKRMAREDSRIRFCGESPANRMAEIYDHADCVIVPSIWYETYNFVLREALACGCIGVASEIGALPEVIVEGENGFLFEPGNPYSLKAAIKKAVEFDWSRYRKTVFPQRMTEARQYRALYQQTLVRGGHA